MANQPFSVVNSDVRRRHGEAGVTQRPTRGPQRRVGLRNPRDPSGGTTMTATDNLSTLVPSAKALMEKIALAEAEKCSEEMRRRANEEAEKKALIDRLTRPSGLSDEQVMKKAAAIIDRAA